MKKAKEDKGSLPFYEIPLDLIETEGQSVRDAMDDDHVVELAMSIARHGLLEPIVLRNITDGRFQLIAGFHRLAAFHRLRKDTIPAHVITDQQTSVKALALIENIIRRDLSLTEEVNAVCHLYQEEKLSPSQICDLLGKSRAWVDRRLMIPSLPDDVRVELMEGIISIAHAEIIGKIETPQVRAILINQTITGRLSARQTHELAELYLATPAVGEAVEAGLKKAREIQAETKIYRKCEVCEGIHDIANIIFMPTCVDCRTEILRAVAEQRKTEEGKHGD